MLCFAIRQHTSNHIIPHIITSHTCGVAAAHSRPVGEKRTQDERTSGLVVRAEPSAARLAPGRRSVGSLYACVCLLLLLGCFVGVSRKRESSNKLFFNQRSIALPSRFQI